MTIQPVKLQLLTSLCTRNGYYMQRIETIAHKLGLNFTLEQITDKARIESMGISLNCFDYYCPGCIVMHAEAGKTHCAPALFINGELAFSNYPPTDFELEAQLARYG